MTNLEVMEYLKFTLDIDIDIQEINEYYKLDNDIKLIRSILKLCKLDIKKEHFENFLRFGFKDYNPLSIQNVYNAISIENDRDEYKQCIIYGLEYDTYSLYNKIMVGIINDIRERYVDISKMTKVESLKYRECNYVIILNNDCLHWWNSSGSIVKVDHIENNIEYSKISEANNFKELDEKLGYENIRYLLKSWG